MTEGSFTNFEVLEVSVTHEFNASQLSDANLVVVGNGGDVLSISSAVAAANVDLASIDLSGLQFADAFVSTIVNVSTIDPAQFLNTQSFTITGSDAADVITGSANADIISGGLGDDTITGGAGADNLTGGAGADDFAFANSDSGVTVATADIITDFTTTEDDIDLAGYLVASAAFDYSEEDGSAAADFDALVALADAAFANDVGDGVHVLFNALGTGDAYVFFDASGDQAFGTGDTLIILTGVSTAADIIAADFI
jgi:Ca2+-binding RTX toxin-like protein